MEALDEASEADWKDILDRATALAIKHKNKVWHVYRDMALFGGTHPVKSTAFLIGCDDVTFAGKNLKQNDVIWLHWNQLLDSGLADEELLARGALVFIGSPHSSKQNEALAWLAQCFKRFPGSMSCKVPNCA